MNKNSSVRVSGSTCRVHTSLLISPKVGHITSTNNRTGVTLTLDTIDLITEVGNIKSSITNLSEEEVLTKIHHNRRDYHSSSITTDTVRTF